MAAGPADALSARPARRTNTPSGEPVPRFVSLKSDETYCRAGPSFDHPVTARYVRAGAPVLVVAETVDHWRKIRDVEGAECWIHKTMLGQVSHVIAQTETTLRARPDAQAPARARLAPGVMAKIERRQDGWLRIAAGGVRGWAERGGLWGADLSVAPHN
ncbi:SH3 domain-containing protein [Amphiplicatus metriothermophilus]|nr:SH3 domain-containing protein [Amphiplicatus metriothermophilus]MBB5517537.1 SH3-like domain-containing protein [Amphiplicatus metriothermophilus]